VGTYYKHVLPNYTVFDEERYFVPRPSVRLSRGRDPLRRKHLRRHVGAAGAAHDPPDAVSIGINICADAWERGAAGGPRGGCAGPARAERLAVSHAQTRVPATT